MNAKTCTLLSIEDVEFDASQDFDLALVTCGYEVRSSYLARRGLTATRKIAVRHGGSAGLSFGPNLLLLQKLNWTLADEAASLDAIEAALTSGRSRLAIDISSMPRRFIGRVVELLSTSPLPARVTWYYAPALFDESASAAATAQPLIAEPVSDFYNGSIRSPLLPVGLIAGLGLEPDRAIGLMEFLEPSRIWAFLGDSDEPRFAAVANVVNHELMELPTSTVLTYPVSSVAVTFSSIESLVFATRDSYRLVIAPSGPKIFGLAALLVGATAGELGPAVWRVGGRDDTQPSDVAESGVIVAATSTWGHEPEA